MLDLSQVKAASRIPTTLPPSACGAVPALDDGESSKLVYEHDEHPRNLSLLSERTLCKNSLIRSNDTLAENNSDDDRLYTQQPNLTTDDSRQYACDTLELLLYLPKYCGKGLV